MSNESVKKNNKSLWISLVVILVLIPAAFAVGNYLGDRKMYITSVIIMFLSMIPFFAHFESRKPQARELVIIAIMCALTVASRAALVWLPNFKPMGAIVMMTGMAFGPQAGFLTGSLGMLISNMIFGQGPWTPWQMFAYGLVGFGAAFLYKAKILDEKKPLKCAIVGFVIMVAFVGIILDTCSVFTMAAYITKDTIWTIYLFGLPVNITQGICVALTMFFLVKPIMAKLMRIKNKYGVLEI